MVQHAQEVPPALRISSQISMLLSAKLTTRAPLGSWMTLRAAPLPLAYFFCAALMPPLPRTFSSAITF